MHGKVLNRKKSEIRSTKCFFVRRGKKELGRNDDSNKHENENRVTVGE